MPTIQNTTRGQVVQIWGKAYIRGTDGVWRPLAVGEVVPQGSEILTEQDAIVMMTKDDKPLPKIAEDAVERAIAAVENNEEPPAAGLLGGGSGDLQPGLRVDRIVEWVTPATINTALDATPVEFGRATQSNPAASAIDAPRLIVGSSAITSVEAGGQVNLGLARPSGPGTLTITVTTLPAIGEVFTADGTPVAVGSVLTADQLAGLVYRPPADYSAGTPVGSFGFSVSNGIDTVNAGTQIAVTPVNDAPVALDASNSGAEDILLDVSLRGTDIDGTIASVTVRALPANGALLLADTLAPVTVGQVLTPAQAAGLLFRPNSHWNGSTSFTFTVTDNEGAVSAPATVRLTITPVNDPPVAVNDTSSTVGQAPVTVAVLGNDTDADNDTLSVTTATVSAALGSVVINADGSLTFTAAAGVTGPVVISYSISDGNGGTSAATLTVNVAAAPVVTVDAPALTNDSTPTLTGSSNLPQGSTVTLTVTDALGAVQTFTTTVRADGTYSVDVPAVLAEGPYTAVASVNGPGGSNATANDNGVLDITPPVITVDAPALTNDTTPALTGTTDLPAGSTLTLTVTGANGVSQLFTTTVQIGGVFSVDVPAALVQGNFNVTATATDAAGNSASATDSGVIDTAPPVASITIDPVTADNIVNAGEATGNITLTGTVGGDVQVGDTVTLNVNGVNYSGLVLTGNTFAISVPGAGVLADADRRIDGSVTTADAAGNSVTATAQRPYAVNTAPIAVNDALSIGEDTVSASSDVTPGTPAQDRDADGDTLTVIGVVTGVQTVAAGNVNTPLVGTWGTLLLDGLGAYTYAPSAAAQALDPGQTVTDTFTYTISDGRGGSATATLAINVVGANDPTTISGVFIGAVTEDAVATASGTLSNNDPDVGTRPFVAQTNSAGSYGLFSIDSTGTWTYTLTNAAANVQALAQGQSVTETFIVATDDGTAASITVTVNGTNDAPVVSSTSINAVEEGAAVGLGLTAPSDIDNGSVLVITVSGLPTIGQVQLADGAAVANGATLTAAQLSGLRYLPPADHSGAPVGSFTYSVSDGIATVNGGTTINVSAVNDRPVAIDVSASGFEDTATRIPVTLAGSDVDGTVNSFTLTSVPANGQLFSAASGGTALAAGAVISGPVYFRPNANFNGTVSFGFTATDNSGAISANTGTATIVINPVNDAPTLAGVVATFAYTEGTTPTVVRSVIDGSVVLADIDSPDFNGGSVTVAISNVVAAEDVLGVRNQGTADGQISVVGTSVNYNPVGAAAIVTIGTLSGGSGSTPLVINLNANASVAAVDALLQNITYGNLSQQPTTTPRNLSFTVVDGDGTANGGADTVSTNVTVNLTRSNDAPIFTNLSGTRTVAENAAPIQLDSNATLNDPEIGSGFLGSINNLGGAVLTLARNGGANAQDQFSAGGALTLSAGSVIVGGVTVGAYDTAALANGRLVITFANGTTVSQGNSVLQEIRYANTSDAPPASVAIGYTLNDGNTGSQGTGGARSTTATVNVNITPSNDPPVANADSASTPINTAISNINVLGNDTDPDTGAVLSVTGATVDSARGTVTVNPDGTVNFTPANNVTGPVTITYTLSDGTATTTGTLTVNVGANTPPTGADNSFTIDEDTTRGFGAADFGFADADLGQTLQGVRIDTLPTAGTLTLSGAPVIAGQVIAAAQLGNLVFTPVANANGAPYASFTFSVQDSAGSFDAAPNTVTMNVTPQPDTAVIGGDAAGAVTEDGTLADSGALTVTDPDAGQAAFNPQTGSAGTYGSFSIDAAGTWTYNLANASPLVQALAVGQQVTDTFAVTTIDGTSRNVVVTITGTNDVPVVANASASTAENTTLDSNVPAGSDIDGTVASYALGTGVGAGNGALTFNADGSYVFNPNGNFDNLAVGQSRQVTFTYTATDNSGGISAPATVTITVTGANDAPTGADATYTITEDGTRAFAGADFGFADVDVGDTLAAVRIDSLPTAGTLTLNGAAITAGQSIAAADLANLVFTPVANANGAPYASFTFSVQDSGGLFDAAPNTITLNVTPVNDPPVAVVTPASGDEDTPIAVSLAGTDLDGTIASVTVTTLPGNGTLFLADGLTPVVANVALTPAQAASLVFVPAADFNGTVNVSFTVTDNSGAVSALATTPITVAPVVDPTISIDDVSVNEADGTMTFTVSLSAPTTATVSVNYATGNGTATSPADYTAGSGTLSFAAGVTSQTVTVSIAEDAISEGNETFNVTLSTPVNATIADGTGVGTIIDNDGAPTLAVSSPTVGEAGGYAVFTLTLSNASATATTFSLALANGTATGADFGPALEVSTDGGTTWVSATSATFAAGATSALVRTPVIDDTQDETDETFTLTATRTAGTTNNASAAGTATISDNDATPSLSIDDVTVNEAAGTVTFIVTLSAASGQAVSVDYATGNVSATAGADYTAGSGTLNFAAGVTSQTVTINIAEDTVFEGNETFNVTLSSPTNATIADSFGVGTITDNDVAPTIASVSSPTVSEGTDLVYTVNLSNASASATTFAYTLGGGSAAAADYGTPTFSNGVTLAAGVLTVPAGVTSFQVTLPTTQDALDETNETVPVTVGGVTGTGTITDDDATPSLSINDVTVNEAAGTATFTVTLSAASGQTVTVGYNASNGTATAGSDYSALVPGTLSFAPGVTSQTVTVTIAEDTVFEGNETFNVNLTTPTNASIADGTGVGTITDNDAAPTIAAVSSPTVAEGTNLVYTVSLSNASSSAATFAYTQGGGSAAAADYGTPTFSDGVTLAGGVLTVPAGVTSFSITLPTTQDALDEIDETVPVTVGGVAATGTITDDDATPSLSINNVTVNEAAGTMTFTVTLSAASGQAVSVDYATSDVSATAGNDYTAGSGTLSFAPGVTSQTVTIDIAEDTVFEGNETFNVTLSSATNATIADNLGVGTITDNDAAPTLSVSSPTVAEGSGYAQFTLDLSNPSATATTVSLALANGSATGADYGAGLEVSTDGGATWNSASSATFGAGATSVLVRTPIADDAQDEADETFTLTATRTAGSTSNASAIGIATITDNDATPSLSIGDVSVNENAGTMTFTVTLSAASGQAVSVNYATSNATATAGADYTAGSGTLAFAPGVTSQTITVAIAEDLLAEGNESFNVTLGSPSNATIADGTGVGTIVDNDGAPTLTVSSPTVAEGSGYAQFTLNLSNPSATATTVSLALADGTATSADYGAGLEVSTDGGTTWTAATSATFSAGATSVLVRTPVVNDVLDEADETFTLTATRTAGSTSNTSAIGTATITDDDATPSLSINDVTVDEAAGTMSFTVSLSAASGQAVSVNYATSNVTATAGADYTAGSGVLNFAAGVTSQTVTIDISEDTVFEGNETFNVTLSSATNATIADNLGVGTITDNDVAPAIASVSAASAVEATSLVHTVTLSNASSSTTTFSLSLTDGTATGGVDYTSTLTNAAFSNGVTISGGTITVPAGVISFTVTVPTSSDVIDEADETYTLAVGAASGAGTINDDDAAPTVSSVTAATQVEGTTLVHTVTLTNASSSVTTFAYTLGSGTATGGGTDYTTPPTFSNGVTLAGSILSVPAGITSFTVSVPSTLDTIDEGTSETYNLSVGGIAAVGTITDDDNAPTISSVSSPTVAEGTSLVYAVSLSNASSVATSFAYTAGGGSAAAADYGTPTFSNGVTLSGGILTVPAGVTAFSITLPTTQDAIDEIDETIPVTVGGVTGTGTITDDDATPSLSIDDVTVDEAAGTMTFTVTLSAASGLPVSVGYATGNGTATAGTDYTAASGTLNFAAGVTSQTITVNIGEDNIFEGSEDFTVTLSGATNATITDGSGLGTITDNDAAPTIASVSSPSVAEGGNLVYAVALSNPSSTATTFAYSLGGGSAEAADHGTPTFSNGVTLSGGILTVPAGVTNFSITLPTTQDALDEINETVPVTVGGVTGTGTINDNDATPSLSIDDVTVNEAAGTATFTVTLSAASGQSVSVNYATGNGTATAGSDYTAGSGTLTFAPGVTSQTVTVTIAEDTVFEGSENFNVNLTSPSNATIADNLGVGTITDNDSTPTISSVSAASAVEATSLVHTVTLSNASSSATTFSLSLTDGTATGGDVDYASTLTNAAFSNGVTISGGTITVPAGVTSFTITVPTSGDTIDEANETYTLAVGSASGAGTINDDDNAPTVSSVSAATQVEGVTLVHTITLSNASSSVTTFAYALGGGSATGGGTDYTTPPTFSNGVTLSGGVLSVPAGVTSFTVSVPSTLDTIDEGASETYDLSVGGVAAIGTISDDDNAATVSSVSSPTVTEGGDLVYAVSLSNASSSATNFAYALGGGSAAAADHGTPTFSNGVTLSGGILTVPAGVTSFSITLPTTPDTLDEANETVPITVGGVTGTGTITDDDVTPSLSVNDVTVNEAAGTMTFIVTLSAASGQSVSCGYATGNVTATAGADYAAGSGTLTFAPGVTSQTVTVAITNDTVFEGDETFNVTLSGPTNATIADGTGVGTINDNDATPTIASVSSPTVTEGSDLIYTVNLSNASSTATTFAYTLGGGSAAAADHGTPTFSNGVTLSGGILTVPAGVTAFSITVPTTQDALDEASETVPVTVGGVSGTGTITDDDATPSLSISGPASINEAAGTVTYTVTLSAPSGQSVSVNYGTTAGTATAGADFTTSSGTLTFTPGVTSQTFTVPILNDGTYEGSESFTVNLSTPSNATIATGSVTSNILDDGTGSGGADNDTPSLSVSSPTVAESDGFAVFTVSLSNAAAQATTVSLATASGTATSGTDFAGTLDVSTNGGTTWTSATTATIAAGSTSVLVRAPIVSDTLDEANETFTLTATRTAGTTSNAGATGTATITDDDNTPTIASVSAATAAEATSLVHTVTLSNASSSATTFSLSLTDGTATGGGVDYTSTLTNAAFSNGVTISGGTITVPAGVTSFTVTVPSSADTIDETNETYTLAVGSASGTGAINDDDAAPTVSSVTAATQVEGVTLLHTVTLSNASSSVTTFAYTLGGGSATGGGTDYTTPPTFSNGVTLAGGILSVPAGVTSFTVSVPSTADTIDEGASETYDLSIGGVTALGTITDDDTAPTISSVSSPTVTEGSDLVYTVTLSNASATATTFAYVLGGGTAGGIDFGTPTFNNGVTLAGGVLTVPAGVTSFSITLPTTPDTLDEANETVPVTVGGVTGTGTITDDDATPSLSVDDVTVNEAAGTMSFTVTLSAASGLPVSVGYNTSNGTAAAGSDYTAASGTLNFAAGVTSQTVTVFITNDTVFEGNETFNVNLTSPTNATIADGVGVGTISDNDAAPTISSVSAASAVEATSLVHTVTLSNASASTATFSLSLTDVTAAGGGVDYTSTLTNAAFSNGVTIAGGTITVPAGVTSFTVTVPTSADTIDEANETYTLAVGAASGTGTIDDDDNAPTVSSVSAATQVEGVTLVHTVTLSNASSSVTTFAYTLGGGSATGGGTDYTTPPTFSNGVTLSGGVLSVPAGVTSFTVSVPSTLDTIDEGASETYNLSVGGVAALGTITDDDDAPTISSVSSPTVTEGSNLVYAVTLSNASSSATTFAYTLGGGSAAAADYGTPTFSNGVTLSGGNLTVPAGVTSFSITLPTTQDALDEANETVPVTVGGVSGTGTITDNDPTPSLAVNDVTVNEAAGTMSFTVTLSAASGQSVSVNYGTGDGTAIAGGDYTAASGTVTFTPGQTTQTITVPITNDTVAEPGETLYVNLSSPSNATISDGLGIGTVLDNDATPTVSSVTAAAVTEGGNLVHTVTLSNASSTPTTLAYTLASGTATAGTDFNTAPTFSNGVTLAGGVLTVPAGVASFTVTVASIGDVISEANETYNVTVGGVTAVGTINDNDPKPTLSVNDVTVFENQGFAVFTVSLSTPSSSSTLVNLALLNGTATGGGNDYGAAGTTNLQVSTDNGASWTDATSVTIPANATSVLVRTPIINNAPNTEPNETFTLRATHSGDNTLNTSDDGTGTIIEPNISIDSPTVTEGTGAGTTLATFTVTLSNRLPAGGALVPLVLSGSSTASAADYGAITVSGGVTLVGGVLNIPQGTTSFTINVPVTQDALNEQDETLVLNVGGAIGTLTITDDDAIPTLAINDVTVNEGAGTATFTVTLSAASGQAVTVGYSLIGQTALSGVDFTSVAGTLTFAPGTTTQTITVPILQDNVYEGTETFRVNLSAPTNATIADGVGIGTIRDNGTGAGGTDNDTPTLAVSSIIVSDQSAGFATFVVSLSNASATATSVSLALANGTATGGGVDYGAAGATNLQVSTDNGVTWSNATTATIAANATYVLVRTPITADVANEVSETLTLTATRTAGTTTNASAIGTGTITDIYNGPDAISDAPSAMLQEDTPAATVLAGNVIQGGSGNVADTDPNSDSLSVTGAAAGNSLVTGVVALASPLTVSGIYGNLVIQADGTYTYTLDNARIQTQNMIGGQVYNDVFSYRVTDGNGGYDTATITVQATGTLDLTAIKPQPVAIAADGLQGEYYGYNDITVDGNRAHADDGSATSLGSGSNLESVEDITAIINGRNLTMGGAGNIVGTNLAGATNAADVIFNVRTLNYGTTPVVNSSLGSNSAVGAGNALPPQDNNSSSTSTALANFLDQDAATARAQTGTPTGTTVGTQTGLGTTTDAIVRMSGLVYLERGNYDFRVTGDDGFRLRVGGETLIEFDGNQPPTTRTYSNVEVNDRISGLTAVELLYWEQGGNANLQFEFKLSDSNTWVPFSLDSIAFFSAANAPTLTDTRIQDIVETNVNQQYELRTGSVLDGDANTNTLTGAEGRDYVQGFGGNDILNGNGSADFLDGGIGNDALNGGDGNDILVGGTGNDTMTGGTGDDIYRVDGAGDVVVELAGAGQGTDTIEFEASYNVGTYVVGNNVENALLLGAFDSNVTGNAGNNRITGNDGNNILIGGAGDDRLLGGRGNDTLSGDAGALAGGNVGKDIFEWNLADRATAGAPAIDRITDFTYSGSTTSSTVPYGDLTPQHTDALDLRDLLVGESSTSLNTGAIPNIGNLQNYIDISVVGGETSIRISSTGGFDGGTYAAGQEDQRIVLSGVDLYAVTGTTTEAELLQRLLANGTLVVD